MPRTPEPWYWEARQGWYVQVKGRRVPLGADTNPRPKGAPKPPPEVMREYYRVMRDGIGVAPRDRDRVLVPEACEAYLAAKEGTRASTAHFYKFWMRQFAAPFMGRTVGSVTKPEILKIAESHSTWSPATKHHFVLNVTMFYRWARDAGYLDFNPLAGWSNPYPPGRRTRGITDAEFTAIVDSAPDLEFKRVMHFMRGTGCRIGEAVVVTAAHVHPTRPLVTLAPSEHKTGRTGRPRVMVMPADVEAMVRSLCHRHPKGPIFRNSQDGRGWGTTGLRARFRRYRKRLGISDDVSPHTIRHATLTRLLDGGTDAHLAAKIAGHANTTTLLSTYYHPDVDLMIDASNAAHGRKTKG